MPSVSAVTAGLLHHTASLTDVILYRVEMKRILLLIVSVMVPVIMSAQAQIITKDEKIEDFPEKTTKVVLSGNDFFDAALKEEVRARWNISAFEFCTLTEFQELKSDDSYYFLMPVKSRFRRESEPGIEMLTLIKGGEGADKGLSKMLEIVSMPVRAAKSPSGREFIFLPAMIDIIQEHVVHALERGLNAYSTLAGTSSNIMEADTMKIVFSKNDISDEVTPELKAFYFRNGVCATDEEVADNLMLDNTANTLVSYTVSPSEPVPGSYCYKMLINAGTHELYYFRKHKITKKRGAGFLAEDLMRITADRE